MLTTWSCIEVQTFCTWFSPWLDCLWSIGQLFVAIISWFENSCVLYASLLYAYTCISICLQYLHILWMHCFRKQNCMVNICLPLHELSRVCLQKQLDIQMYWCYLPPYNNCRILQNICFVQIQRRVWKISIHSLWLLYMT